MPTDTRDIEKVKYRALFRGKVPGEEGATKYDSVEAPDGQRRRLTSEENKEPTTVPRGFKVFTVDQLTSQRPPGSDPFPFEGRT